MFVDFGSREGGQTTQSRAGVDQGQEARAVELADKGGVARKSRKESTVCELVWVDGSPELCDEESKPAPADSASEGEISGGKVGGDMDENLWDVDGAASGHF